MRKRGIEIRLPPKQASRVTRSIETLVWSKLITMFWKYWLTRYSTAITAARIRITVPKSNSDLCPEPTETESSTFSIADMSRSVLTRQIMVLSSFGRSVTPAYSYLVSRITRRSRDSFRLSSNLHRRCSFDNPSRLQTLHSFNYDRSKETSTSSDQCIPDQGESPQVSRLRRAENLEYE